MYEQGHKFMMAFEQRVRDTHLFGRIVFEL